MIGKEPTNIEKLLQKAVEAIETAKYNLKGGFLTTTANRAYYACYYCITALLDTQNVKAKTHHGAKSKFTELFIKTGIFPSNVSDSIAVLFDFRQSADYDLDENLTLQEAELLVTKATEIYTLTTAYLKILPSTKVELLRKLRFSHCLLRKVLLREEKPARTVRAGI